MQERAVYDRLWADAQVSFRAGDVEIDPLLTDPASDDRLGLTLAARFDGPALERLGGLLDDLRALAPEQHIYRPDELHIGAVRRRPSLASTRQPRPSTRTARCSPMYSPMRGH